MTDILGPTRTTLRLAEDWAIDRKAHSRFVNVIPLYIELAPIYGIPAENGIGQAAKETNYGHYTGVVPASFHNWCGLKTKDGSDDIPEHHQAFLNDRAGVEAHLQHLLRYAGGDLPAGRRLIDPRWHLVTKFTDTIEGLGGAWAPAPSYGTELAKLIRSIPVEDQALTLTEIVRDRIKHVGVDVQDIRNQMTTSTTDSYTALPNNAWIYTAIHHTDRSKIPTSLSAERDSWARHSDHHVNNNGWPGIAYAIGVSQSGRIFILRDINLKGFHAFTANSNTLGIACDIGLDQDPSPAMIDSLSVVLKVLHEHSPEFTNLTGRAGTYGHQELGFIDSRNTGTECPGHMLEFIQGYRNNTGGSGERHFDEVPFTIRGSIRERWESVGDKSLPIFGLPLSPEYEYVKDQKIVVRQKFQRVIMEYDSTLDAPWDVTCIFISDITSDIAPECNNLRYATRDHIKQQRDALDLLERALP